MFHRIITVEIRKTSFQLHVKIQVGFIVSNVFEPEFWSIQQRRKHVQARSTYGINSKRI